MCCNNNYPDSIRFPGFTRYACCNPCCDGSVSAERVDSVTNNCGCGCGCCCCCCRCCGCNNGNVGGVNDNNRPCPCRGGW